MGKSFRIVLFVGLLLIVPSFADAAIGFTNGKWSTTYNYGPCSQQGYGGEVACHNVQNDGIIWNGSYSTIGNNYTQVTASANNPIGAGGNGYRMWVGDGNNIQSGVTVVEFPSHQKEVWVRWYERYQAGFKWNPMGYAKELYFSTDGAGISVIPEFTGTSYVLIAQGVYNGYGNNYYQVSSTYGWDSVMGGSVSDGKFHCYEVHIKMDTDGGVEGSGNGVGQLWIDGILRTSNLAVDWSKGSPLAQNGWKNFQIRTNQNYADNGQNMYVDVDDIVVYNTTPPNRDAAGNPYIGPIGSSGGSTPSDTTPPTVSNPLPSGTVSYGTTQANIQVTTSEASTCKYGTTNLSYASLPNTFTTTGNLQHSQTVTGLSNGGSYTYYVHCRDTAGNIDTSNKVITFTVSVSNSSIETILFQDNFDNCTTNCVASSNTAPSPWGAWHGAYSAIHDGISHYSGEISSPGRGATGKSLKIWRHSVDWEGYAGGLLLYNYNMPANRKDMYMRYSMKLPTSLDLSQCSDSNYLKLWRFNTTSASPNNEIYLNINQNGGSSRESGRMYLYTYNSGMREILSNADLKEIWDGNWHTLEFHMNLSTGLVEFWVDGVMKYTESNWSFGAGEYQMMQHFSMGNHASGCTWQNSWQAMELDDFALATSYIGPVGGGTPSDTTPPAAPTGVTVL